MLAANLEMSRKALLDIGAHTGETLRVALEPQWGFDRIYCFEPAPECWEALESLADSRVELLRFGLWSCDDRRELFGSGGVGASLYETKEGGPGSVVDLRDAAQWFADNLRDGDTVIAKLNCEGAEVEILSRLLDRGELDRLDELLVHFDVRKVPGMQDREQMIRRRLDAAGTPYRPAESIFFGRNVEEKTRNWLGWYHAGRLGRLRFAVVRRAEFAIRSRVYRARRRPRGAGRPGVQ